MIVTLRFNLPEEKEELEMAQKGIDYSIALDNIRNHIRSKLKYSELSEAEVKVWEEIQENVYEEIRDLNLS